MAENLNNPSKGLDALLTVKAVTMGQVALLEKMYSPLLTDQATDLIGLAESVYLLSLPFPEALDKALRRVSEREAYLWLDRIGPQEFIDRLEQVCRALCDFYQMLPKAPPDEKKSPMTETAK